MTGVTALGISTLLASATGWGATAPKRYVFTGPDAYSLKGEIIHAGAEIISALRYEPGFVIEANAEQAGKLRLSLELRNSRDESGADATAETPEVLEEDGTFKIDYQLFAIVNHDPTLETTQRVPWGIQAVHAREAQNAFRGSGADVCVIDTGVQFDHPDLLGNVSGGENVIADADPQDFNDDNGHGTHVAGTIAALDNSIGVVGVAPEAKIYAVKALSFTGTGNFSALAEAIHACLAHHAKIINMSLGFSDDKDIIRRAVRDAVSQGAVLVAAAGNEKSAVDYPARYPGVVAVSSLGENRNFSYFSNFGPEVSFIAPGENVLSTYLNGQYAILQGTSQATPHVAGVAALLLSKGLEGNELIQNLKGDDVGLSDERQGSGLIDALKTLGVSLN